MKIYFASQNRNKIREISAVLPSGIELLGIDEVTSEELEETGSTLEENAVQKAVFVAEKTGENAFADDTGLEIDALNGAPGVISARYAGEQKVAADNCAKVLSELNGVTNRKAQFRTVIALIVDKKQHLFEGVVHGSITHELRGSSGFGYDPIFIPDGSTKTFAEMTLEEKNQWSHRARAVKKLIDFLEQQI
jgi:XTP/dITP diphosphohydrolase